MTKKILLNIGISILLLTAGSSLVQAYQMNPSYKPDNEPFALATEIEDRGPAGATVLVLQIIAGAMLYFAVPIAVIMLIMAASQMVIGGAETEKLEQVKKNFQWSIIGLVAIILSYSIVKIIISFVIASASFTANNGTPPPVNP